MTIKPRSKLLKVGAVVSFKYRLIHHPDTVMSYRGIVLGINDRFMKVWCLRNEHVGVFRNDSPFQVRKVKV